MKCDKKYYKSLDLIRLIACFGVLLYHLNILKGGYLAVCTFFVLSGYLACISAFRKEKFSLLSYYKNRLINIYLPLLLVVFITIFAISFIPDINWINLKPETTSVLLGYNNFWQLEANLDYFARHINSPFMHFWYIGILLQFELIFPFIFIILRKIGDKVNKLIPCILISLLGIIGSIYFYKVCLSGNIMSAYYDTFARVFSLFFGLLVGFIHNYYKPLVSKKLKNNITKFIILFYLIILITLFILVDSTSLYFPISMIGATLITCRLIDYGTIYLSTTNIFDKIVKFLSSFSYEIYLFQYPVIFLFQYLAYEIYIEIPLIILITIILSMILHLSLKAKKESKLKFFKYLISTIIFIVAAFGAYKYVVAKDHTEEMAKLEEQLNENALMMQQKQEEYANKLKEEENKWAEILADLENGEAKIAEVVTNLNIVGIGDSVMLGAIKDLYQEFPNGYFDAKTSRTAWVANGILKTLKNKNMLGDAILFNLGANGDCPESCKIEIMKTCENRKVFWINTTNDVKLNNKLNDFAVKYENLHIIDWYNISKDHPEYFVADKIHLTAVGRSAYTNALHEEIYKIYLNDFNKKKEEILKEHEEAQKNKISFIGNNIILNGFEFIKEDFESANFILNKDFSFETIKNELNTKIANNTLEYKIVFAFDNSLRLNIKEYEELIEICKNHEIYILKTNELINNLNKDNIKIIDLYEEIKNNSNYLMVDKIHLTEEGNIALKNILKSTLLPQD